MNNTVNFLVESGVSLALLSLIYVVFLRKETFFVVNRLFLIGSVIFSVMLPFLKLRVLNPQPILLSEITVSPYGNLLSSITVYGHGLSGNVEKLVLSNNMIIAFYISGVALMLVLLLFRIAHVILKIRNNPVQKYEGFKLVLLDSDTSPYSFLNYVFIGKEAMNSEGYQKILVHELEHVKQGHSFDVLILELLTAFQWFNPFMWMLRRAIRENHEFLADRAVLSSGTNRGEYKMLLLSQAVNGQLVITNNFNYSIIKNRIKMMSKIKSSKIALTKITIGVLVAVALVLAFACEQKESVKIKSDESEHLVKVTVSGELLKFDGDSADVEKLITLISKNGTSISYKDSTGKKVLIKQLKPSVPQTSSDGEEVFFIVENMPEYPGGEMALREFIAKSVKYPAEAQKKGIQGKVYVTFTVGTDGNVKDAKIARGADPSLDAEALRVVNGMPAWKPGKQKGVPVNVSYTVPINFKLQ